MSIQVNKDYIEVPNFKETFMEGLLDNLTKGCNTKKVMVMDGNICTIKDVIDEPIEATELRKYLEAKKKGDHLNHIGPLDKDMTILMEVKMNFDRGLVTWDVLHKAHKKYLKKSQ